VISKVLSNSEEDGILISVNENGYYLIPKAGRTNYTDIKKFVKNIFGSDSTDVIEPDIEVYNGSGVTGQANKVADKLKKLGLTVTNVDTNDELIDQTIIYSAVAKSDQIDKIELVIGRAKIATSAQKDTIKIIIGRDYAN